MKSAVLITDVQRQTFDTEPRPFEAEEIIGNINLVTGKARKANVPVFFIQHEAPGFMEFESLGWQLQKDLVVEPGDIRTRKTTGDSFLRSDLDQQLKSLNVGNLVICGYASEFCIDNTIRRATGLGYTVQIVSDAHTTHDKPHLAAKQIREHHNITLSMGPTISTISAAEIGFDG